MADRDGTRFTWIFDCGAKSGKRFDEYLRPWTTRQRVPVDWLFISHFDFDHVSGLDTLMGRSVVREVMVPYVDDEELIYVLLGEIARANLDRGLVDLIADPAAFFLSRGAARVTFLNGGRPGEPGEREGPEPPDPGEPTGDKDDRGWATRISKPIEPLTAPVWARTTAGPSRVGIIDGGTCVVTITRGSVGLRLKPYRAPIAKSARQQLLADARALVGPAPSSSAGRPGLRGLAYAIAQHARTAKGRAELRGLHKKHTGSSNRASLSLLSEPFNFDPAHAYWHVRHPSAHYSRHGSGAWMNTGDAELLAPGDLADWRNCYSAHLAAVRVLALPHHGSDKNSDGNLQALCPDAVLTAHAKSTSKKHPGPDVSLAAGGRLTCVTKIS
jgi:hypothetical protein